MNHQSLFFSLICLFAFCLGGCGQTGKLYLPGKTTSAKTNALPPQKGYAS